VFTERSESNCFKTKENENYVNIFTEIITFDCFKDSLQID